MNLSKAAIRFIAISALLLTAAIVHFELNPALRAANDAPLGVGPSDKVVLPEPFATKFNNNWPHVLGWPAGRTPIAPAGFHVTVFADGLKNPRWLLVLPNGDVLVAESDLAKADPPRPAFGQITLLREANNDGVAEFRDSFLLDQNLAFGMTLIGNRLYVGNNDAILRFPYQKGQTKITASGEKIATMPTGGHYTRNLLANAYGSKIYVAVGSSSNGNENGNADAEPQRAAILEMNPDGSGMRVFAGGIRNPVGMDWEPQTHALWTVVNERNTLGDDLVPDYFTSVREGEYYGWPYAYFGRHEDPTQKVKRPDLVAKTISPDYSLGAHRAPLGLLFYRGSAFPSAYRGGAFITQHGSLHRAKLAGYNVVFIPFRNGKPSGEEQEFLTGFIANEERSEVYGRPVGLAMLADGSMLIADDAGNRIWRVTYGGG